MDSHPIDRLKELRARLHETGLRLTPQREAVWRLFAASNRGYTLPQTCQELEKLGVGQATVYRMGASLQEMGFLRFIHDADGGHRYLACPEGHTHYVVCRLCGRTRQVTDCDLRTLEKLIVAQSGYHVEGHHLEFFGLCPDCLAPGAHPPHPLENCC